MINPKKGPNNDQTEKIIRIVSCTVIGVMIIFVIREILKQFICY
jgi:hypothetical protein